MTQTAQDYGYNPNQGGGGGQYQLPQYTPMVNPFSGPKGNIQTPGGGNAVPPWMAALGNAQFGQQQWAANQNQQNLDWGRQQMLGQQQRYMQDPNRGQSVNMLSQLMSNPYSLNQQTQNEIMNRQAQGVMGANAQGLQNAQAQMAYGGRGDANSLMELQRQYERQGQAQLGNQNTQLQVQAAQQRTQDMLNALGAARGQNALDASVMGGSAQALFQNQPQYQGMDLGGLMSAKAGLIAAQNAKPQTNTMGQIAGVLGPMAGAAAGFL